MTASLASDIGGGKGVATPFTYPQLVSQTSTPNIPHVVLANQYDAMNERTQLTATVAGTADFINAYSYDADQRMLQATQQGQTGGNGVAPKGIGYAYNLNSQMTSVLRFDPTTSSPHPDIAYGTLSYDSANRLTEIKYTHSGNTLDDLSWTYDAASRVTTFTSSVDGTATYSYDSINGANQRCQEPHSRFVTTVLMINPTNEDVQPLDESKVSGTKCTHRDDSSHDYIYSIVARFRAAVERQ